MSGKSLNRFTRGDLVQQVYKLRTALAECVDANDELHNALCNDSKSEPRHHEIFVAAQRRETAAIENARKLLTDALESETPA